MLITLGINHHSAPLAVRERLSFGMASLPHALSSLIDTQPVREAAILSTCNRTELYCNAESAECLADWLAEYHHLDYQQIHPYLYSLTSAQAIRHAFRVASGLDSMVLGEPQILGQMKDAMRAAEAAGTLGTQLHKLFQRAFSVAKEVRSSTTIGANVVSMAAASVHLGRRLFESISTKNILFIGAGEMIELCMAHFASQNPGRITIANRTLELGESLAGRYGGSAIRLNELPEHLAQNDIVISCTASPLPIIGLGMAERAIKDRQHRPMLMVDLAVPRDIEAEVGELEGISLHTVDDLAEIVTSGYESRQAAVHQAESIITTSTARFLHWLEARENVPVIRALRDSGDRLRRHELERAMKLLAKGENAELVLEQLSQRLTNKLLHAPSTVLHLAEGEARNHLQTAAIRLFHLNK